MLMGVVVVVESFVVTPSKETPSHAMWLSPLDLVHAVKGHTPTVYLYGGGQSSSLDHGFFDVDRLKASLGKALVDFYPLAGRLSTDQDGRLEIDCAGQGVPMVIARSSDLTIDALRDYHPSPELKRLFVPRIIDESPSILCAVQVTLLKCGGVVLGTALHHAVIDGTSAFSFFKTWSALCRSRDGHMDVELELPCHDRTLLRTPSPPSSAVALTESSLPPMKGPFVEQIFFLSADQVAALKRACSAGAGDVIPVSTFCAVSTHVWRCMCAARRLPLDATTRLIFAANIRRILRPPLPDSYFGNAIIDLEAVRKVVDIIGSDSKDHLATVARRVRDASRGSDDQLVRSTMELEIAGSMRLGTLPETEVKVVSWLGMPVYHTDFGWGNPLVMMRAEQQNAGFVYLADAGLGDGSVHVMCTESAQTLKDLRPLLYAN